MKLFKREDFLKLPYGTIYSRVNNYTGNLMDGLFCKVSGPEFGNDWLEQDLLSETATPIDDAIEIRDAFREFQTNFECCGRDGCFDDNDVFVVYAPEDVRKLADFLTKTITTK